MLQVTASRLKAKKERKLAAAGRRGGCAATRKPAQRLAGCQVCMSHSSRPVIGTRTCLTLEPSKQGVPRRPRSGCSAPRRPRSGQPAPQRSGKAGGAGGRGAGGSGGRSHTNPKARAAGLTDLIIARETGSRRRGGLPSPRRRRRRVRGVPLGPWAPLRLPRWPPLLPCELLSTITE